MIDFAKGCGGINTGFFEEGSELGSRYVLRTFDTVNR